MKRNAEPSGHLSRPYEFHVAVDQYGQFNPAYNLQNLDPLAKRELQSVFFDLETGKLLSEAQITKNIEKMTTSLSVRLKQVQENGSELPPASPEDSEKSVRTFLKTVQEVLTNPLDRKAFKRGEGSVEEMVIDPLMITDTLLENLGLANFRPPKRTRDEDKPTFRANAIPSMKQMLAHLEPLAFSGKAPAELNYFRLMRIGAGKNQGYVLGTQNIERGQKILFKTDIHGAKRRLLHIEDEYRKEIETLTKIRKVLENAKTNMDYWRTVSKADLDDVRSGLFQSVDALKHVRNADKKVIRDQISKAMNFKDATGRDNPTIAYTRFRIALDHLNGRIADIEGISGYIGLDKTKVGQLLADQVTPVEEFLATVEKMHGVLRILKPDEPIVPAKKAAILGNLRTLKAKNAEQKYEPYLSFSRKFNEQIDKVITALETDDRPSAKREFTKIYLIAKLEKTYKDIQDVYETISVHPDLANPDDIMRRLEAIQNHLRTHTIAPELSTDEYTPAYIEIYHLLNSLKKRLSEIKESHQQDLPFADVPRKPQSRIDQLLDKLSYIPKVGAIVNELRGLFGLVFKKPASPVIEQKPLVTRESAYLKMKRRINEFDFVKVADLLP